MATERIQVDMEYSQAAFKEHFTKTVPVKPPDNKRPKGELKKLG